MPQDPIQARTGSRGNASYSPTAVGHWGELVAVAASAAAGARCGSTAAGRRSARGIPDRDHVPGELLAAERVLEAVSRDLTGLVLGERVERVAVVGDLGRPVGPLDRTEPCADRSRARGLAGGRHRLPEGVARAGAQHLARSGLLIRCVEGAS